MAAVRVTRQVVVDDTDPTIKFVGSWSHDQGLSGIASPSDDRLGGPAYNDTSTFAETDLGLEFAFIGTEVNLYGGINFEPSGTFATCALDSMMDNSTSRMIASGTVGTNNNILCSYSGLSDEAHVLTFNLGSTGSYLPAPGANGAPNRVWVDRIVYTPSASVPLDTVPAVMIYPGDPLLEYSTGWEVDIYDNNAMITSQENGSVMFTFEGTSVAYYGMLINDVTPTPSSATYSIDGQPPIAFSVVDFQTGSIANNAPFFSYGKLTPGQHILTVVNHGNASAIPLGLKYLIVQPSAGFDDIDGTPPATTPPSTGSSSSSDADSPTKHSSTAKIIGAVVGVVGGLLLILGLFLFLRRRRQLRRRTPQKWAERFKQTSQRGELENPDTDLKHSTSQGPYTFSYAEPK